MRQDAEKITIKIIFAIILILSSSAFIYYYTVLHTKYKSDNIPLLLLFLILASIIKLME